jgi:hypothetical protein
VSPEPNHTLEREKAARRADRTVRHGALGFIVIAAIAVIDLANGFLGESRRIDAALLALAAVFLGGALQVRLAARQFGSKDFPPQPTPARLTAIVLLGLASLVLSAAVGYLIGGWFPAVLLPTMVVLTAGLVGLAMLRRDKAEA